MSNEIHFGRFACLWLLSCSPVIYAGCGGPRLDVPAPGTYSPLAAVSLGIAASETNPAPSPTPSPTPGKCENCNGTGKLGDGTVSVPCPVCGGDGRTDEETRTPANPNDPLQVPIVDEPKDYPPPWPQTKIEVAPPVNEPLTEEKRQWLRDQYQEPVYERRGLFRGRWRGGSVSSGAAAGSC